MASVQWRILIWKLNHASLVADEKTVNRVHSALALTIGNAGPDARKQ